MAALFDSMFGFGIFGIITIIFIIFVLLTLFVRNINKVVPFITSLYAITINFFLNFFKNNTSLVGADNCSIIPGSALTVSRVPSTYLAHVVFFFAFIFTNAYTVYVMPKEDNMHDELYENRINRTSMIMTILVVLYIIIVVGRYNITGCESYYGILFTTVAFGALGFGTYKFGELCGIRSSDVLGITTSFVPKNAESPVACAKT